MVKVMETQTKCFLFPLFPQSSGLSGVGHSGGNDGRVGLVVTVVVLGRGGGMMVILEALRMGAG